MTAKIISIARVSRFKRGAIVRLDARPEPREVIGIVIPCDGEPIAKLRGLDCRIEFVRVGRVTMWDDITE